MNAPPGTPRRRKGESPEAYADRVRESLQGRKVAKSYSGYCRRCWRVHKRSVRRKLTSLAYRGAAVQWLCSSCLAEVVEELQEL